MTGLLTKADGPPVAVENPDASGPVLLICEHASRRMPERLGTLGLSREALNSHIAWDSGALAVSRLVAETLDATLIHQRFSRLAYDCNRPPEADTAIPSRSEIYTIPGNASLSPVDRSARVKDIYLPFRNSVSTMIAARKTAGRPCILVTVHSFTPFYHGQPRSVELGILHDADGRLADAMLAVAGDAPPFETRRNAPYGPADGVTHTLIEHGLNNRILNVMIEIRNDIIKDEAGQRVMAGYLTTVLGESLASLPQ